jgi:uncharacterized protein (TIGR03083 family)
MTVVSNTDPRQVARFYLDTKERITALVSALDDSALTTTVAACPGWSVRDVVAHCAAVADDLGQGRLTGPPTDVETAAQIARFEGHDMAGIIAVWTDAAARLGRLAENARVEPPVGDVTSHEHDVRGALGRPGARDSDAVRYSSDRLLGNLRTPVPLRVTVEDAEYRCRRRGLTSSHYAIRSTALADRPPQPWPARGDGLVRRPGARARPPVHLRPGRRRPHRIASQEQS